MNEQERPSLLLFRRDANLVRDFALFGGQAGTGWDTVDEDDAAAAAAASHEHPALRASDHMDSEMKAAVDVLHEIDQGDSIRLPACVDTPSDEINGFSASVWRELHNARYYENLDTLEEQGDEESCDGSEGDEGKQYNDAMSLTSESPSAPSFSSLSEPAVGPSTDLPPMPIHHRVAIYTTTQAALDSHREGLARVGNHGTKNDTNDKTANVEDDSSDDVEYLGQRTVSNREDATYNADELPEDSDDASSVDERDTTRSTGTTRKGPTTNGRHHSIVGTPATTQHTTPVTPGPRSWTPTEQQAAIRHMKQVCSDPKFAGTEKRFQEVSRRMKSIDSLDRSPAAVKLHWNRFLRNHSGFEDRSCKRRSDELVTSALTPSKSSSTAAHEIRKHGARKDSKNERNTAFESNNRFEPTTPPPTRTEQQLRPSHQVAAAEHTIAGGRKLYVTSGSDPRMAGIHQRRPDAPVSTTTPRAAHSLLKQSLENRAQQFTEGKSYRRPQSNLPLSPITELPADEESDDMSYMSRPPPPYLGKLAQKSVPKAPGNYPARSARKRRVVIDDEEVDEDADDEDPFEETSSYPREAHTEPRRPEDKPTSKTSIAQTTSQATEYRGTKRPRSSTHENEAAPRRAYKAISHDTVPKAAGGKRLPEVGFKRLRINEHNGTGAGSPRPIHQTTDRIMTTEANERNDNGTDLPRNEAQAESGAAASYGSYERMDGMESYEERDAQMARDLSAQLNRRISPRNG